MLRSRLALQRLLASLFVGPIVHQAAASMGGFFVTTITFSGRQMTETSDLRVITGDDLRMVTADGNVIVMTTRQLRITEESDVRITEDGDLRVLE